MGKLVCITMQFFLSRAFLMVMLLGTVINAMAICSSLILILFLHSFGWFFSSWAHSTDWMKGKVSLRHSSPFLQVLKLSAGNTRWLPSSHLRLLNIQQNPSSYFHQLGKKKRKEVLFVELSQVHSFTSTELFTWLML